MGTEEGGGFRMGNTCIPVILVFLMLRYFFFCVCVHFATDIFILTQLVTKQSEN